MIPQAVLAARGGGGSWRSLARSLHIYKLAFQSCRYMTSRAENIHVFLIQAPKNKQNTSCVSGIAVHPPFSFFSSLRLQLQVPCPLAWPLQVLTHKLVPLCNNGH